MVAPSWRSVTSCSWSRCLRRRPACSASGRARSRCARSPGSAALLPMPITNERSIFRQSNGQRAEVGQRRVAGAEVVDAELDAELASSSASASSASSRCSISVLSVISSVSRRGGRPWRCSTAAHVRHADAGCARSLPETLTCITRSSAVRQLAPPRARAGARLRRWPRRSAPRCSRFPRPAR